jgi:hypothetical protein
MIALSLHLFGNVLFELLLLRQQHHTHTHRGCDGSSSRLPAVLNETATPQTDTRWLPSLAQRRCHSLNLHTSPTCSSVATLGKK